MSTRRRSLPAGHFRSDPGTWTGPALLTVADCNASRVKRLREAKEVYRLLA